MRDSISRFPSARRVFKLLMALMLVLPSYGPAEEAAAVQAQSAAVTSLAIPLREQVPPATLAGEWGLTEAEFLRYQQLMQGPRGLYSPGLDPLTALGVEARSDEERRRYAELQVQAERQRVGKELAYQRAYDEANARLYPGQKTIELASQGTPELLGRRPSKLETQRLAVFVEDDCTACIARVRELQGQRRSFDLYFVGSDGDDERIRRWATAADIEPQQVRSRRITLNHDQGRWHRLGLGGELPAVVSKVEGQWRRQ